jgi:hypothetical protein
LSIITKIGPFLTINEFMLPMLEKFERSIFRSKAHMMNGSRNTHCPQPVITRPEIFSQTNFFHLTQYASKFNGRLASAADLQQAGCQSLCALGGQESSERGVRALPPLNMPPSGPGILKSDKIGSGFHGFG